MQHIYYGNFSNLQLPERITRHLFLPSLSAVLAAHEGDDDDSDEEDGGDTKRHQDDRLEPHRDLPVAGARTRTLAL